jgi:hypothetical protein
MSLVYSKHLNCFVAKMRTSEQKRSFGLGTMEFSQLCRQTQTSMQ